MNIGIRPVRPGDRATLLRFVGGFQDYERGLHPNRRPAAEVSEGYLAEMEREVAANHGALFMAEVSGEAVGFVCCYAGHDDDMMIHAEARPHGYVADIFVAPGHRGRGVGAALLAAAEDYLAGRGFNRVRLSVLAANADARAVYEKRGYRAYEVVYEKPLGGNGA